MSCDQFDKKNLAQELDAVGDAALAASKKHKNCVCDCKVVKQTLADERRQRAAQDDLDSLEHT